MEFKKPSRQRLIQPTPFRPPRGDSLPAASRPSPSTLPHEKLKTTSVQQKNTQTKKQLVPAQVKQVLSTKKGIASSITALLVVGILIAGATVYTQKEAKDSQSKKNAGSSSTVPDSKTVSPGGKSVEELGGWKRVSPPGKDPVFAFTDSINGVPINVSQQAIPKSFEVNTSEHVADLASKFSATNKIEAGGTTVYIGNSTKGPQSVIFTKDNLLILIKSQNKIDDKAWTTYIQSLS